MFSSLQGKLRKLEQEFIKVFREPYSLPNLDTLDGLLLQKQRILVELESYLFPAIPIQEIEELTQDFRSKLLGLCADRKVKAEISAVLGRFAVTLETLLEDKARTLKMNATWNSKKKLDELVDSYFLKLLYDQNPLELSRSNLRGKSAGMYDFSLPLSTEKHSEAPYQNSRFSFLSKDYTNKDLLGIDYPKKGSLSSSHSRKDLFSKDSLDNDLLKKHYSKKDLFTKEALRHKPYDKNPKKNVTYSALTTERGLKDRESPSNRFKISVENSDKVDSLLKEMEIASSVIKSQQKTIDKHKTHIQNSEKFICKEIKQVFAAMMSSFDKFVKNSLKTTQQKIEGISRKIDKIPRINKKIRTIVQEKRVLMEHMSSIEQDYSKLRSNLSHLSVMSEEFDHIKKEHEDLKEAFFFKNKELEELKTFNENQVYGILDMNKKLQEKFDSSFDVRDEKDQIIERLQEELREKEYQIIVDNFEYTMKLEKLEGYEKSQTPRRKEKFDKLLKEKQEKSEEIHRLQSKIEQLSSSSQAHEKDYLLDEVRKLKEIVKKLETEKLELVEAKAEAFDELQTLKHEILTAGNYPPAKFQQLTNEISVLRDEIAEQQKVIFEKNAKIKELREIFGSKRTTFLSSKLQISSKDYNKSLQERLDRGKGRALVSKEDLLKLLEEYEKIIIESCEIFKLDDASELTRSIHSLKIDRERVQRDLNDYIFTFGEIKDLLDLKNDSRLYVLNALKTLKNNEIFNIQDLLVNFARAFNEKIQKLATLSIKKTEKIAEKLYKISNLLVLNPSVIDKTGNNPFGKLQKNIDQLRAELKEKHNLLEKVRELLGIADDSTIIVRIRQLKNRPTGIGRPTMIKSPNNR